MIYVTHDFEEATFIADRLVVLMDGRVAADGRPADLFENPPSPRVAHFLGYSNRLKTECGHLYFRPWDVAPGGRYRGRVVAVWYRAGRHEVLAEVDGQHVRLLLPQPPAGGYVEFDVARGRCFPLE